MPFYLPVHARTSHQQLVFRSVWGGGSSALSIQDYKQVCMRVSTMGKLA